MKMAGNARKTATNAGIVTPNRPKAWQHAVGWVVFFVERLVTASLRCHWQDDSGIGGSKDFRPVIFCLWHNRLAISMLVHRRHPRKLVALISASRDGALLAAILNRFGVEHVRGSSSRRGPQALLELTSFAQRGFDLAVTPDGPKGPRYIVKEGVVALAQVTGLPIIPVTADFSPKLCLKSWDGFQIPLPFARCRIILHEPIFVPRDADAEQREERRQQLERKLRSED